MTAADNACNAPAGLEDEWAALHDHAQRLSGFDLKQALQVADRAVAMRVEACGLTLDYTRALIDPSALQSLLHLPDAAGLAAALEAQFSGERINRTENRAALHMALRAQPGEAFSIDGQDVMPAVLAVREKMLAFAEKLHSGEWRGASDEVITDIVNIGIGGSDLGPRMVCAALRPWHREGVRTHFVANVDPDDLAETLSDLEPASTLFIITSKTFTTAETMANARTAREWLVGALGEDAVGRHFVAASTNREAVTAFGIDPQNMFEFWDWVGGRYSLWSAVGLSILLQIGAEAYMGLLRGAAEMDTHARSAPAAQNLPVLMALLDVWYRNFLKRPGRVVVPYAHRLRWFVPWLQQLEMESNGKTATVAGGQVAWPTSAQVWGDVGSNAQHAFFQQLHQGPDWAPVDFILPVRGAAGDSKQQNMLVANCLAQAAALAQGRDAAALRNELLAQGLDEDAIAAVTPHRLFAGNRPSNLLTMAQLDPFHLGALLAACEHKVFIQGVVWGICSFDQSGVELGKQIATQIEAVLDDPEQGGPLDAATRAQIRHCRDLSRAN